MELLIVLSVGIAAGVVSSAAAWLVVWGMDFLMDLNRHAPVLSDLALPILVFTFGVSAVPVFWEQTLMSQTWQISEYALYVVGVFVGIVAFILALVAITATTKALKKRFCQASPT